MGLRLRAAAAASAAGVLSVVAVASMATAAADPPPPDPNVAAPPQNLNDILAPPVTALLGQPAPQGSGVPVDLLLSQYPAPSVPGSQPPQPMDVNTAIGGNAYLLPQNYKLAPPDEGNLYSVRQGDVPDQPSLIPALKGAHALWHGAMGRLTPDQLGQPLPGTAPPPGTNIPAGPVDYLPDQPPWLPAPLTPPPPPPG